MTGAEVMALLGFLDEMFTLGGKLVDAAVQKHPELLTEPLPGMKELDAAREDAVKRSES